MVNIRNTMLGSAAALALLVAPGTASGILLVPTQPTTNDFDFQFEFDPNPPGPGGPGGGNFCEPGGLDGCTLDGSLAIVKLDFDDDGSFTVDEVGNGFTTIDGNEFSFDFGADGKFGTGIWTYTPDADDPGITGFTVKSGPSSNVFVKQSQAFAGLGDTSEFFSPNDDLSNMVFFDSVTPIPVPAALPLFATAVAGLAVWRRRRRA